MADIAVSAPVGSAMNPLPTATKVSYYSHKSTIIPCWYIHLRLISLKRWWSSNLTCGTRSSAVTSTGWGATSPTITSSGRQQTQQNDSQRNMVFNFPQQCFRVDGRQTRHTTVSPLFGRVIHVGANPIARFSTLLLFVRSWKDRIIELEIISSLISSIFIIYRVLAHIFSMQHNTLE